MQLSSEQKEFIKTALAGYNILVDACIGSGKTTSIQQLCNALSFDKHILYLTYNKLLKIDAKSKILNANVKVTNYHGFAYECLMKRKLSVGISDLIQAFNKVHPPVGQYDILIIDEYQDIDLELSIMLKYIKEKNPGMQIIAVGDMEQKIYDKTALDVKLFIEEFLGDNKIRMNFTKCFRLSKEHAAKLGRIWGKTIDGVNDKCVVEVMSFEETVRFLAEQDPKDILCLGARIGDLSETLNYLEMEYPEKFNKKTLYASISDTDRGAVEPRSDSGIFTTFDSSKGLERKICVVFDYTESYWRTRISKPQVKFSILRNIFCVAASRGKERIIFVKGNFDVGLLSEKTLSSHVRESTHFEDMNISEMFDFKYKEDVEECFSMLKIKRISEKNQEIIQTKDNDELIDLAPCIGVYQEAAYFQYYDLDKQIEFVYKVDKGRSQAYKQNFYEKNFQEKILALTAAEYDQIRYVRQVEPNFISKEASDMIMERLSEEFGIDEEVQVECSIEFPYEKTIDYDGKERLVCFEALGLADVVQDDVVYELKFVTDLKHEHFLQCACYIVGLGLEKGVLMNTKTGEKFEIKIRDKEKFLDLVIKTVTKRYTEKRCVLEEKKKKKTRRKTA